MPGPRPGHHDQFQKDLDPRDTEDNDESKENQASPAELTIDVPIDDNNDSKILKIGSQLNLQAQ